MNEFLKDKVFIRTNENSEIVAINSSSFLDDTKDWLKIDEGTGDKFHHAQNNYFDEPLRTNDGVYRYKYLNNAVIEKDNTEISTETADVKNKENIAKQIDQLKHFLAETDYAIIKIAEGVATPEKYADIITQRQEWRAEINRLEGEI